MITSETHHFLLKMTILGTGDFDFWEAIITLTHSKGEACHSNYHFSEAMINFQGAI